MKIKESLTIIVISIISRIFYMTISYLSSISFTPYDNSTYLICNSKFNFLLRWDAINFYTIAKEGYISEHMLAFFPLYPLIVRFLGNNLFIGILISNIFFIFSGYLFYTISFNRYNTFICYTSTLLFLFNPASIVFSTMYSESLFTFLFLLFFYFVDKSILFTNIYRLKNNVIILCTIILSLLCITRSNGILILIFNLFYMPLFTLIIILIPFLLFQIYGYIKIQKLQLILPYSYIQIKYWQHGFLKFYFDSKNWPNFLISIPFSAFSIYLIFSYFNTINRKNIINSVRERNNRILIFLLIIQTFMAIFFIHSQIFFRFVAYNPIIYWSLALMIQSWGVQSMALVLTFYVGYSIAYAILFGAYYPPA